ncbi:MAG TPA: GNAT family N-acetyltransferase [Terriglobales bacterium]
MPQSVIYTDWLVLRPCEQKDLDTLQQISSDDAVRHRFSALVNCSEMDAISGLGLWAVQRFSDGPLIGFCGFDRACGSGEVEMLYGFWPAGWEEGAVKEACQAALSYLWTTTAVSRVLARTRPQDRKSMAVMERLGMCLVRDEASSATVLHKMREQSPQGNSATIYVAERPVHVALP